MKKLIYIILTATLALAGCQQFDHTEILEQLREHEERILKLEAVCNKLSSNVEAVQAVMAALEGNDYVTDVTKLTEDGVEVGYSITLAKGGTVNIYHGSNGADAPAPKIGIRKASDGEYYWTSDNEWLTDEEGEKIPASVPDDPDGKYITPSFRIAEGVWYISYDGGNTWQMIVAPEEDEEEEEKVELIKDISKDDYYVYITLSDDSTVAIPLGDPYEVNCKMSPYIEIGPINPEGGFGVQDWKLAYYRTPRFLRVTSGKIAITPAQDCEVDVCQYNKDFGYMNHMPWKSLKKGSKTTITLDADCRYVRLMFRKNSSIPDFALPRVTLENVDPDEIYVTRSADEGYQRLVIPVNVADASASHEDSWELQDESEVMKDYGLLVLPETYSNIGKPTRLIIYCHGAGVNYPTTVSRFTAAGVKPEYWLKEGYAVMDIEGNPFDNTNEHFYIPQARQAYEKAYNWVINTYNICQDGVFLGGRSMGGGMCFELLQSHIPILAACPLAPCANTLWVWNTIDAGKKKFCAEKMGFKGTAPTWTSKNKLSDEEFQYLYDNFDQMIKYSPFWRGIENLPDKDVLFGVGHISASTKYDEAEDALYSTLRFKSKAPVKIFTAYEDNVVPYRRNAELMYKMLKNAGQVCELRLFHTDASSPHNFEVQDSRHLTEVTTTYGETVQAPLVYVEMLQFWRRYEPRP